MLAWSNLYTIFLNVFLLVENFQNENVQKKETGSFLKSFPSIDWMFLEHMFLVSERSENIQNKCFHKNNQMEYSLNVSSNVVHVTKNEHFSKTSELSEFHNLMGTLTKHSQNIFLLAGYIKEHPPPPPSRPMLS